MVSTEALFLTSAVNAKEGCKVMTIDIPGAFMHADIDKLIHVQLEGPMIELLTRVDPQKYVTYVIEERGKMVLYVKLKKALYGTLQAAMLFWANLMRFLTLKPGFTVNPHNRCVVNKMIDREQCTIIWHVDDLKLSHIKQEVLDDIASKLNAEYGKEAVLTVHHGAIHDYLRMYSEKGKVKFFTVGKSTDKLDDERAMMYHHLTAKMLYLCKRAHPDLQTVISFLTTQVTQPGRDDWKKLRQQIQYLRGSKDLYLKGSIYSMS